MSMTDPLDPFAGKPADDGIPAADAGTGAPDPAEGFGVGGEEPDRAEGGGGDAGPGGDPPFRTPDPEDVGQ
jgi:hypothetical protein